MYVIIKVNNSEFDFSNLSEALEEIPLESITATQETFVDSNGNLWVKAVSSARHRQYATKDVTPTMAKFSTWIAREFPELGDTMSPRDQRLIMIASKTYSDFQSSDLNPPE
jgi:hypothetical protein